MDGIQTVKVPNRQHYFPTEYIVYIPLYYTILIQYTYFNMLILLDRYHSSII